MITGSTERMAQVVWAGLQSLLDQNRIVVRGLDPLDAIIGRVDIVASVPFSGPSKFQMFLAFPLR